MAKTVYTETSDNIHFVTQSGDFLALDSAGTGSQIDVKKHLRGNSGRVLITTTGSSSNTYNLQIKINPLVRIQKKNVEEADEIVYSWENLNILEYSFTLNGLTTWNSGDVFGRLPIHSFELVSDGNLADGVDLVFLPFST